MAPGLEDFAGAWRIRRRIEQAGGGTADFEGEAHFVPDGAGLAYAESGLLRLGRGPAFRAERRYLWRAAGAGEIAVLFEDGRRFHRIDLSAAMPRDRHRCAPDLYEVCYDFSDWPGWRAVWSVRGPRKDYVMSSRYERGPAER